MNEPVRLAEASKLVDYEGDFFLWTQQQAQLLRNRSEPLVDWSNVAEEIESLGRRHRRELGSRLRVLILHLLKYQMQPAHRSGSWGASITVQRRDIEHLLQESPSLRREVPVMCVEEYELVVLKAVEETGLSKTAFPEELPFEIDAILATGWLPRDPSFDDLIDVFEQGRG